MYICMTQFPSTRSRFFQSYWKVNRKEYGTVLVTDTYTSLFRTPHYYLSMLVLHSLVLQIHSHQCIPYHHPGLTEVLVYGGCALWLENHKKWCWPETNCRHYCESQLYLLLTSLRLTMCTANSNLWDVLNDFTKGAAILLPGKGTNPSDADSPLKINIKTS